MMDVEVLLPAPFAWVEIPGGKVTLDDASSYGGTVGGEYRVAGFAIAKYPTTNAQYQVFVDAKDGYADPKWWDTSDAAKAWRAANPQPKGTAFDGDDHPRTNVCWYDSMAFCGWLSARMQPSPLTPLPQGEGNKRYRESTSRGEGNERYRESTSRGEGNKRYRESTSRGEVNERYRESTSRGEVNERYRELATQAMVGIARDLRQRQTNAESILWECLRARRLGIKFRRQHPIAGTNYVVDFLSYEYRLVVELDGGIHDTQQEADAERQREIEALGYRTLRFRNEQVFSNLENTLVIILHNIFSPRPEG